MYESVNVLGGAIRVDFVALCILIAFRAGRLNFSPTFCVYCRYYLVFKLTEAIGHMSLSFSFRHNATKVKKIG